MAPPKPVVPLHPTGAYAAACLAAGIGLLTLAAVQVGTVLDEVFKETVFDVGKAWIPNAEGIGPYSGKETLMVVAWLASWVVLHAWLKERDLGVRVWFGAALTLVFLAAILVWPPIWHLLEGS